MPTICTIWAGKGTNLPEPSLELDHSVAGHVLGLVVEGSVVDQRLLTSNEKRIMKMVER